jgi:SAM-dependent methyltransferase
VLDLGLMPLANRLLTAEDLDRPEPLYPLAMAFCPRCLLVQITDTVRPEELFRQYAYFSSVSDAMVEHAREIVDGLIDRLELGSRNLVVELASNDGYLLQHYVARGIPVLGVDPARNIAEVATARGIPTRAEFFGVPVAREMRAAAELADVVHANNVLAHVPDIHDFIEGIATILKPTGVAVIETPYVRDLVERLAFDTIYHEHVFYYSVAALIRLFEPHQLELVDVERTPIHGGSLRLFVMRAGAAQPAPSVAELLDQESALGMTEIGWFQDFGSRVQRLGEDLRGLLVTLKAEGGSIAAYGAAAKGAILLNAFRIGTETIDFVADRSPHKVGQFMPGVRIPIRPAHELLAAMPDVCLLLAWNFADEILGQQSEYRRRGGRFILPVPEPRVV